MSRTRSTCRRLSAILAGAILIGLLQPASAQVHLDAAGASLRDTNGDGMALLTIATGDSSRGAVLIIEDQADAKSDFGKRRLIIFADQAEWKIFCQLWDKARTLPAGKDVDIIGDVRGGNNTRLEIGYGAKDDSLLFTLHDASPSFTFFFLTRESWAEFAADIDKVNAYFTK